MVDKYQTSIKLFVAKSSCRAKIFETLQTYKGFSRVIYSILNGSAILERNETRLERNETRLARNETRGGKLPLSGTVKEPTEGVGTSTFTQLVALSSLQAALFAY